MNAPAMDASPARLDRPASELRAIGLKHHQDVVVQQDSPSLRGQIKRVRHLLEVTPVTE